MLQSEGFIDGFEISDLFVGLKSAELFNDISNPELHHHAGCFYLGDLVEQRFELLDVGGRFIQAGIEISDEFLG